MKKKLTLVVSLLLVMALSIGGTLAYLTDKTAAVTNTFTIGKVDIDFAETTGTSYKMIPGQPIVKDPTVTVKAGSEACWLFVKIEKSDNFDTFLTTAVATGWTELQSGVYYRQQDAVETNVTDENLPKYPVLKDNQVVVNSNVTNEMMAGLTESTQPTLTFTAYAIQSAGFATPELAWAEVSK